MAFTHSYSLVLLGAGGDAETGRRIDCFDRYDVAIDMMSPGSAWTFSLWRTSNTDTRAEAEQRLTAWASLMRGAKLGGQILFSIDDAPQLNGVIEDLQVVTDRSGGARLIIAGRDLSANALDWDADPRITLKGVPLETCLSDLFNRVGINVVVGAGADAERLTRSRRRPGARGAAATRTPRRQHVDLTHARPGERVWQVAESIVRKLGYMMWVAPNSDGVNNLSLVVDVPNYDQASVYVIGRPERDGVVPTYSNVIESTAKASTRDVPTLVYVSGRAMRGDGKAARHRPFVNNTVLANWNGGPERFPGVVKDLPPHPRWMHGNRARSPDAASQTASRTISDAMKNWRTYTCTVQGHGHFVDGVMTLYAVNSMARVYDRVGGFTLMDEDMLIQRVEFSGDRKSGQTTRLTLGTKGAIVLTPDTT